MIKFTKIDWSVKININILVMVYKVPYMKTTKFKIETKEYYFKLVVTSTSLTRISNHFITFAIIRKC